MNNLLTAAGWLLGSFIACVTVFALGWWMVLDALDIEHGYETLFKLGCGTVTILCGGFIAHQILKTYAFWHYELPAKKYELRAKLQADGIDVDRYGL